MREEDMEDNKKKPVSVPVPDKATQLKLIIDRMAIVQRRNGMEMPTIKGQARAYLFAMELRDLGFKPEDLK